MLEVSNIYKSFNHTEVLKGVSIQVQKGDVVVILGPSGSGKTTFLRCINFLERADRGKIDFGDFAVDARRASAAEISAPRRRTAFVFQNYSLFSNKTALENVTAGLIIGRKIQKTDAIAIGKRCLDKVGLSNRYDYYPSQLSGGQQQRVGIARALALRPDVILFDEPTSSLDPELVGEVLNVMKQVAQSGITMLVVTHEMNFAQNIANKVVFMENGRIVEQGPSREIFSNPKEPATRRFLDYIYQPFVYQI